MSSRSRCGVYWVMGTVAAEGPRGTLGRQGTKPAGRPGLPPSRNRQKEATPRA
jgi:hypothetical protein